MKCYVCNSEYSRATETEPEERCYCNLDLPKHYYDEFSIKEKIKVQHLRFLFWVISSVGNRLMDKLDRYALKRAKEL